jgi:hypothetical protein
VVDILYPGHILEEWNFLEGVMGHGYLVWQNPFSENLTITKYFIMDYSLVRQI